MLFILIIMKNECSCKILEYSTAKHAWMTYTANADVVENLDYLKHLCFQCYKNTLQFIPTLSWTKCWKGVPVPV